MVVSIMNQYITRSLPLDALFAKDWQSMGSKIGLCASRKEACDSC